MTIHPSASTSEDGARFSPCNSDYHLIRMSSLKKAASVFSCCGSPLTVAEERQCRRGLVSKVSICCTLCGKKSLVTDPYREEYLQPTRSILGMRVIGNGSTSLESFTEIMGMLLPLAKPHFSSHTKAIHLASTAEKENQFSAAVENLGKLAKDDEIVDIQGNGPWSKRGHQVVYGVVAIVAWETVQVIDTEVLSKYCAECQAKRGADTFSEDFLNWYEEHQAQCHVNHYGSLNAMEADGAVVMWQ